MRLDVAHSTLPKVGEIANGDRPVYRRDEQGLAVIAVFDGLGHGPEAEVAATTAARRLAEMSLEESLLAIMEGVHDALSGTRGAAGTVCMLRNGIIEACAVGNVELRCGDLRLPLVSSAGVLGVRVRNFRVCEVPVQGRARVVLFSDGISSRTPVDEMRALSPQETCEEIVRRYRRQEDDATVLVADIG